MQITEDCPKCLSHMVMSSSSPAEPSKIIVSFRCRSCNNTWEKKVEAIIQLPQLLFQQQIEDAGF